MEVIDRTGQPVTLEELNDAIHAVEQILLKQPTVLPLFTVNGMSIRRALLELRASRMKAVTVAKTGVISIESLPLGFGLSFGPNGKTYMEGVFEVTTSEDGRVWINVDGACFIRFKPHMRGVTDVKPADSPG